VGGGQKKKEQEQPNPGLWVNGETLARRKKFPRREERCFRPKGVGLQRAQTDIRASGERRRQTAVE